MTKRRFLLHLLVGLLTFLIGLSAAVAFGGFNPLERFYRSRFRRELTIPPQSLTTTTITERTHSCPYSRPRTAELRHRFDSLTPPPPPAPIFEEENERQQAPLSGMNR